MKKGDFGSGALRAQARTPGRREGGFAAWGRAARRGAEVRFAAFARRRPRGPVLRTLPRPGHERRFAAHEKPRTSCPALKTMFRPLFMPDRAAFAARASAVRAGQWLSCGFVAPRAARRGALRASTTIHETHAYASPTQRKPSALRHRGRLLAFLWDGSGLGPLRDGCGERPKELEEGGRIRLRRNAPMVTL